MFNKIKVNIKRFLNPIDDHPYNPDGTFSQEKYDRTIRLIIEDFKSIYDLSTIEGIMAIPIPTKKETECPFSAASTPEAILKKQATTYKRSGNMDLAIACLRKVNQIMPYSYYTYTCDDYMRLVDYLKKARRFDEAKEEEKNILDQLNMNSKIDLPDLTLSPTATSEIYDSIFAGSDLYETFDSPFVCAECAKYSKRWLSMNGENPKYPRMPEYITQNLPEHKYCCLHLARVIEDVHSPRWSYEGSFLSYCNRPFVDERTREQKTIFKQRVLEAEEKYIDRDFYDMIWEHHPDVCPKSFGAYRRMKSANTKNYIKLIKIVNQRLGYDYYEVEHQKRYIPFKF